MSASYLHDDSSPAAPWVVPILEELTVTTDAASRVVASLQLDEPGSTGALRRSRASAKLCAAWVWEFVDKLAKNIQASSSGCCADEELRDVARCFHTDHRCETVRTPQLVISTYVRKLGARGGRETKSAKTGAPGGAGELVRKQATAGEPTTPLRMIVRNSSSSPRST